ncbi:MAG: DUF4190 domain-containing protein [Terriglobales bacterium]
MSTASPACPHCRAAPAGNPTAYAPAPAAAIKTNGLAIASLVLGILWFGWLGSILAIVFGHIAHSQIRDAQGSQKGHGMATAGLILGYIGIATLIAAIALGMLGAMFSAT